jgi:hypothetical protein
VDITTQIIPRSGMNKNTFLAACLFEQSPEYSGRSEFMQPAFFFGSFLFWLKKK